MQKSRISVQNITKAYLITSMVKFPLVFHRNGILTGILAVFLAGAASAISNLLINQILEKTPASTYSEMVERGFSRMGTSFSRLVVLLFRYLTIAYGADLTLRFLKGGFGVTGDNIGIIITTALLGLGVILIPDVNKYAFGRLRSLLTFLILIGFVTVGYINSYSSMSQVKIMNESKNYYDSLGLTLLCFTQQPQLIEMLSGDFHTKKSLFSSGMIVSGCYIAVGILGYLGTPFPDLNWFAGVDSEIIRSLGSAIFLGMNILGFPLQIAPIRSSLQQQLGGRWSKIREVLVSLVLVSFLVPSGILLVGSSYGSSLCVILSSLTMLVLPSLLHIVYFGMSIPVGIISSLGGLLFCSGVKDLVSVCLE